MHGALVLLALLVLITPLQSASALDPTKAITQYVHSIWRTRDGLPESSVNKILETSDGFLWVGTEAGIARFDGVRFAVFDHTNTPSLQDDFISDLVQDHQGTLWIATYNGGLTSFRDGVFSHFNGIGQRAAMTVAADKDGSVWIGGYGGLKHIRGGKVIRAYTVADGLSGDPVRRLIAENDGSLWIATPGGLNRIVKGTIQTFSTRDGLPSATTCSTCTRVPMARCGFRRRTRDSRVGCRITLSLGIFHSIWARRFSNVLMDRDGNFWITTATEGLLRVSGKQVSRFTTKEGLSSDEVNTIYEDREGNVWVGTTEGGLDRFRDGSFTTYAKEEGLATDQANAVIEDHAGDIWVTTGSRAQSPARKRYSRVHDRRWASGKRYMVAAGGP